MIKISVIIPVYNVENYIKKCLDSVINQTLSDIEIICVDDCGSDTSMEIVSQYAKEDSRIKIIPHQKNLGLAEARNTGMKEAKGEYLAFVDSDDYIDLNFLECLYTKAKETNADIVQSTLYFYYDDTKLLKPYAFNEEIRNFNPKNDEKLDIYYNAGMCWNKIFKTSLIKEHRISFPAGLYWEDNPFVIQAAFYANKINWIDDANYYYRQRSGSIINLGNEKLHFDLLKTHIIMIDFINSKNIEKTAYINIASRFMFRIMYEYEKVSQNTNLLKQDVLFRKEWQKLFKCFKYKKEITKKAHKPYTKMQIIYGQNLFLLIYTCGALIKYWLYLLFNILKNIRNVKFLWGTHD